MTKNKTLHVKGTEIILLKKDGEEYISITDIARYKNAVEPKDIVKNWMRNRGTIEFLGLWEKINNPNFKGVEFDSFMYEAGSNSFVMSRDDAPLRLKHSYRAQGRGVSKI